ncbi:MAG: hypothetical protein MI723_07270 [Caulobacterales bacterium]|nr:hypothetical protein [Caulobacterales bacterium]
MANTESAGTTAGLRGASWDPARIPSGTNFLPVSLQTSDGSACAGVLARRGGERCAVLVMHPREFLPTHYLAPELLRGDVAVLAQAPRLIGNDLRLEHERALLDVAAGVKYLRDEGYERVVLLGNSGGAGLFSFYMQQANGPGEARIARTPGGKPVPLPEADLPAADGIIFLSPHPGQGALLMNCIDPSVTDENDALSMDPELFPFGPQNGFRKPPESSRYEPDFVAKYRIAQRQRVERIDEWARNAIAKRLSAKKRLQEARAPRDIIVSHHTPIITVWRTDADLRCFDLSLDPSARRYGSLWGANPFVSNFGSIGFARTCTADSWLSTWSGISSNTSLAKTAPAITQPALMIVFDGDNCVFPSDSDAIFSTIGSQDKTRKQASGDHHGRPIDPDAPDGRAMVGGYMRDWLSERFG